MNGLCVSCTNFTGTAPMFCYMHHCTYVFLLENSLKIFSLGMFATGTIVWGTVPFFRSCFSDEGQWIAPAPSVHVHVHEHQNTIHSIHWWGISAKAYSESLGFKISRRQVSTAEEVKGECKRQRRDSVICSKTVKVRLSSLL